MTYFQESSVGYEIRFESQRPRDKCGILFCTTGIVFQMLKSDQSLANISHIILDEVHERDLYTDILLGVLKGIVRNRTNPNLKIVIMSASLDVEMFSEYFFDCPVVEVDGRTEEVKEYFLEDFIDDLGPLTELDALRSHFNDHSMNFVSMKGDYQRRYGSGSQGNKAKKMLDIENPDRIIYEPLIQLIKKIDEERPRDGAILVFLPGWEEISHLEKTLTDFRNPAYLGEHADVLPLHSQIEMKKQTMIFAPSLDGRRKVILSTNIAETSVTIDDVVYVIDSGRIKVLRYNPIQKACNLNMEWISKSNAIQRAGRAGRVQEGFCWHMFSSRKFERLKKYLDPDIQRLQLEEVTLKILSLELVRKTFLHEIMTTI